MRMGSDLGKLHRRNYMVKSQLKSLEAKSKALNEGINSDTSIDEWAETYVARADAQIDDVSDYMQFRNLGNLAEKKTKLVRAPIRSNTNAIAPPPLHKWGALPTHTMPDGTEMPGATHEGLGNLALKTGRLGHMRAAPRSTSRALPTPKLPVYGQQRQPAVVTPTPKPKLTDRDRDGYDDHPTITNLPQSGYGKNIPGGAHATITGHNKDNKVWDRFPNDPTEWRDLDNDGYGDNYDALGNMTDSLPQVTFGNTLGTTLFLGLLGAGVGLITYSQYQSKTNLASMKPRLKRAAVYGAIGMGAAVAYQGATGTGQQTGWY